VQGFAATPERFIDVDWNPDARPASGPTQPGGRFTGRISVIADNEPGVLAGLTNAVPKQEAAIENLKIVNRQQDFLEILLDVDVRDRAHLAKVVGGLRAVAGIKDVERARG